MFFIKNSEGSEANKANINMCQIFMLEMYINLYFFGI